MKYTKIFSGKVVAEITSAEIPALLNGANIEGILLQNVEYIDDLTVYVTVKQQEYQRLARCAERYGAKVKEKKIFGVVTVVNRLVRRPVLVLLALLLFLFSCYLPSRVFFLRVEGNVQVPEAYILEVANQCGIGFGAKRRMVRSEKMKNMLLEKIPQLQWAGINTSGCTAVISVREKTQGENNNASSYNVSSIVASNDGIIQSCTIQQGNALCKVGQAVKAGQVLVSGYIDCGIITKATRADAEIQALTFRDLEVVSPYPVATKSIQQKERTKYSLRIGKKLIKFFKDSGNLDTTCGKLYSEEYIYLPGGFRLPVAIVKESEIHYKTNAEEPIITDTGEWLVDLANSYLKLHMISGKIISANTEVSIEVDMFRLLGKYACSEMIGQVKYEEFVPKDDE